MKISLFEKQAGNNTKVLKKLLPSLLQAAFKSIKLPNNLLIIIEGYLTIK